MGAVDKNSKTVSNVTGGTGAWVQYRLAGSAKKVCNAYWLQATGAAGAATDMPTQWEVQGSNDGVNWVTIDARQGETGWSASERRYFEFFNKAAFEYLRWDFEGGGGADSANTSLAEFAPNEDGDLMTPFNLTASSILGINGDAGFQTSDVGRAIRLYASDGRWRWAKIAARISTTAVTIRLYGHALPDLNPISRWRLGTFVAGKYVESGSLYEERLAFSRRFSVYASATGDFNNFATGEEDDDALEFIQAGGGQANDIVWIAESDGALLIGTLGGVRALSGSGIDEALTPSSFKNRRSRPSAAPASARSMPASRSSMSRARAARSPS
ncbi:hypothetical protein AJ88_38425 [Mesorhizobium amorphae CCBAU 01583]|nr:hypothetical protein AJ88_38425 [Mesorhizobium amorphae CCBAU 01583]